MDINSLKKAINLRQELHKHPEISGEEVITKKILMEFLSENTTLELFDRGKWFYALHFEGEDLETIAFRADFDAILDSSGRPFHGCGHDGHSAILSGFALTLEGQKLGKNIVLLYQFGEEDGSGAIECREVFNEMKIHRIYGLHNMPGYKANTIYTKKGTMMFASKGMTIKLTGTQSHASQPELGSNPAYLIGELTEIVKPLSNHYGHKYYELANLEDSTFATVINIDVGNKTFGVSPSFGEISFTIRSAMKEDLKLLEESLEEYVKIRCEKYKMEYSIEFADVFPVTANDEELVDRFVETIGKSEFELEIMDEALRGSEDFGWYSEYAPSLFFFVGSGEDRPSIHSEDYEFLDELIETGVDVFNLIARD